jgi:hypothetical protein
MEVDGPEVPGALKLGFAAGAIGTRLPLGVTWNGGSGVNEDPRGG